MGSRIVKRLVCRLLGHRWNYCCGYAYIADHLWCQRCGMKVLLLAMSLDMDQRGYVSVLRPVLAVRIGRSERRVTERLTEAVEKKFLDRVQRGQKGVTPVYRAMLPNSFSETVYSPLNKSQWDGLEPTEMSPDRPAEKGFSGTPGGPTLSKHTETSASSSDPAGRETSALPSLQVETEGHKQERSEGETDSDDVERLACVRACLAWNMPIPAEYLQGQSEAEVIALAKASAA